MALLRLTSVLLLVFLTAACDNSSSSSTATTSDAIAPAAATQGQSPYPSIDMNRIAYLWINATYMDATFYDLPVSINQSEPAQIQATLAGIDDKPAVIKPGCKPAGHIWFQINGQNKEEADIYFQPGCQFYVWYEDGKPAYSNQLNPNGINFYQNIVNSVKQQLGN